MASPDSVACVASVASRHRQLLQKMLREVVEQWGPNLLQELLEIYPITRDGHLDDKQGLPRLPSTDFEHMGDIQGLPQQLPSTESEHMGIKQGLPQQLPSTIFEHMGIKQGLPQQLPHTDEEHISRREGAKRPRPSASYGHGHEGAPNDDAAAAAAARGVRRRPLARQHAMSSRELRRTWSTHEWLSLACSTRMTTKPFAGGIASKSFGGCPIYIGDTNYRVRARLCSWRPHGVQGSHAASLKGVNSPVIRAHRAGKIARNIFGQIKNLSCQNHYRQRQILRGIIFQWTKLPRRRAFNAKTKLDTKTENC